MKGLLAFLISALLLGQTVSVHPSDEIRKQLAANPNSSLLHYQLGVIWLQDGDLNSAAIEFDLALKGDSQPAWVQVEAQSMRDSVTALVQNRTIVRQVQSEFFVSENEILQKSAPSYSEEARTAGLEGRVLLSGIVTEDGMMPDPRVVQSLGLGLDEMAIAAVKKWRIAPSTLAGKSVASVRTVAVDFALPDKQSRWHLIGARFPSAPARSGTA